MERERAQAACGLVDVLDGVADGDDGLRRVVGNFDAEFLFERHDQLDGVEAVGAQIFDEGRGVGDLVGIHIQVLDDDLLHAFGRIAHGIVSLSLIDPAGVWARRLGPHCCSASWGLAGLVTQSPGHRHKTVNSLK